MELVGSKSQKIKKLAAWKKFEFLIKKTACIPADRYMISYKECKLEILKFS